MSLLSLLSRKETWEAFYEYKTSLICNKNFERELAGFIDREDYLPVCEAIDRGAAFPLPHKSVISKMSSQKKRTVYTYPYAENMVLKLLTWLLLRKYDGLFCDGLFSFRPQKSAKDGVKRLLACPDISEMYSYKVDVSNYFNSIPIGVFLPILAETLADDEKLYDFLSALLSEENVIDNGRVIKEEKGIMAGTPQASFYANIYLMDMDRKLSENPDIYYSRYSDDIIVFAKTKEETVRQAKIIRRNLADKGLAVNPDKEMFSEPQEGWTFLGFHCAGDDKGGMRVDIAPATVEKLKAKMRRKSRSLMRWGKRNELEGSRSAKAFIRVFNRKLLESPADNELSWAYWFFPVINTTKSLKEIDAYAQDCLRYLITGRRTKARFNARYADLKALGYKSLVHEYYKLEEAQA